MPVIRTGDTEADRELAKWDTPRSLGGYRPDGYEPYPKMLYRAIRREDGVVVCTDIDPKTGAMYGGTTCVVEDRLEHERATRQGWRDDPQAALAHFEAERQDVAQAAAEEAFRVQRMSTKAKDEFQALETSDQIEHVTEVPAPRRKARPVKRSHHKKITVVPDPPSP